MISSESENQILISKIYIAQCHQDFQTSTALLTELCSQMKETMAIFAKHPKINKILQENFEILPDSCLQPIQQVPNDEGIEIYQQYFERIYNSQQQEERKVKKKNPWTDDEKKIFQIAIKQCGAKDWKAMAALIKTRSPQQVRSHYQKCQKKKQNKLLRQKM